MKKYLVPASLILLAGIVAAVPGTTIVASAVTSICQILQNIKLFFELVAAGIAVVIIVINGIKWVGSSDDPGARKQAKEGIIHAIVGLIIIILAVEIVSLVMGSGCVTD